MAPIDPDHNVLDRKSLSLFFPVPSTPPKKLTSPPHQTTGQLKDTIQILYETMIQTANYDAHTTPPNGPPPNTTTNNNGSSTPSRTLPTPTTSPPTRDVLAAQLSQLSTALQAVHTLSSSSSSTTRLPDVPRELVTYVDGGRNPDIYTREFVELVRRENQLVRGKMRAFASFRDVLAREMASANPELREDVESVVRGTGGEWPLREEQEDGGGGALGQ